LSSIVLTRKLEAGEPVLYGAPAFFIFHKESRNMPGKNEELLKKLADAVVDMDEDLTVTTAHESLAQGIDTCNTRETRR